MNNEWLFRTQARMTNLNSQTNKGVPYNRGIGHFLLKELQKTHKRRKLWAESWGIFKNFSDSKLKKSLPSKGTAQLSKDMKASSQVPVVWERRSVSSPQGWSSLEAESFSRSTGTCSSGWCRALNSHQVQTHLLNWICSVVIIFLHGGISIVLFHYLYRLCPLFKSHINFIFSFYQMMVMEKNNAFYYRAYWSPLPPLHLPPATCMPLIPSGCKLGKCMEY